jgi:L-aspartate oxidase
MTRYFLSRGGSGRSSGAHLGVEAPQGTQPRGWWRERPARPDGKITTIISAREDVPTLDLLVLGTGVAGLSAAVQAAGRGLRVGVLTKGALEQATTRWAQGGVAAVLDEDPDSLDLHLADTLSAGAGLCDVEATRVLVDEGPLRVHQLIALGAMFDRDAEGHFDLATEGGHSEPRIVHAGGAATGAEVERALVEAATATAAQIHEHTFALDLIVEDGGCRGLVALRPDGEQIEVRAGNVLIAAGGAGQLYSVTTNPRVATADGVAMALRAGVAVADLEFVQFHPTALHHPQMPRPLLSEALRGHGALLRDADEERFVDELQPRDVVSLAMAARMLEQDVDHLWLDATGLEDFDQRFPNIAASLHEVDLDPATDLLPIAPAAHYLCGGIVTDLDGATSLSGLWAAGETTCTGVHGANRLASNSLLEGMVFAPRVVEAIGRGRQGPVATGAMRTVLGGDELIGGRAVDLPPASEPAAGDPDEGPTTADLRDRLQRAMTRGAGVLRDAGSLADTRDAVAAVEALAPAGDRATAEDCELRNLATVARGLLASAMIREESRGSHSRQDFPERDDALRLRLVVR